MRRHADTGGPRLAPEADTGRMTSSPHRDAPGAGAPRARPLTALAAVTNFLVVFDGLVVTVALPVVQRDFG